MFDRGDDPTAASSLATGVGCMEDIINYSNQFYEIDGVLTVAFTDSGVGIEEVGYAVVFSSACAHHCYYYYCYHCHQDKQEKLFHEIIQFSPDELQSGEGTGLGLWIARSIVHLHHGKVYMRSEGMGKGSTFYVDIPAYKRQHSEGKEGLDSPGRKTLQLTSSDSNSLPPTPVCSPASTPRFLESVEVKDVFSSCRVLVVDVSPIVQFICDATIHLSLVNRIRIWCGV
jgi:hypothetical protein